MLVSFRKIVSSAVYAVAKRIWPKSELGGPGEWPPGK